MIFHLMSWKRVGKKRMETIDETHEDETSYRWETFKRSWDQLQEDDNGEIKLGNIVKKRRRRSRFTDTSAAAAGSIQRGIIRHVIVLLDMGESMALLDMKPNRGDWYISQVWLVNFS